MTKPALTRPRLPGSGTAVVCRPEVCKEKLFTVVVPSRFTFTVNAKPSVVLVVNAGMVPAASENMLNPKVLPEVDTPSGELNAGPNKLKSNERVEPKVNASK